MKREVLNLLPDKAVTAWKQPFSCCPLVKNWKGSRFKAELLCYRSSVCHKGNFLHYVLQIPSSCGQFHPDYLQFPLFKRKHEKKQAKKQSKFVAIFNFGYEYGEKLEDIYIALKLILLRAWAYHERTPWVPCLSLFSQIMIHVQDSVLHMADSLWTKGQKFQYSMSSL